MKLTQKARKFLRQWIKDLESGNFRQTQRTLKRPRNKGYSYCCIGLADVSAQKCGLKNEIKLNKYGDITESPDGYDILFYFLGNSDPRLSDIDTCTIANDVYGWNFKKIASELRKKYNVRG